ncbi:LamG-like jellyroll fold domain-containing protein [Spirosoma pulveris]
MNRNLFPLFLLMALLLTSTVSLAQTGTIYYVHPNGRDAGTGTAWNIAFLTLQKALATAQSGSQIWVAEGTYYPDEGPGQTRKDRTSAFAMKNGVSILGGFPATGTPTLSDRNPASFTTVLSGDLDKKSTINDGSNAYHVISNGGGLDNTALLDGFVITGGNANGFDNFSLLNTINGLGGGVLNNSYGSVCSPSFRNCLFLNNSAFMGGAMYNSGEGGTCSPMLTNCSFQNNTATNDGGAMYSVAQNATSIPTLTNCSFLNNTAINGGAMYNYGTEGGKSNSRLINCSFQNNTAINGGAIANNAGLLGDSDPTLTNCSFQNNSATNGGAMYNISSYLGGDPNPTLINCSFQNNLATGSGGAIYINGEKSVLTLTNCVLFGNGGRNTIYNLIPTNPMYRLYVSVSANYCLFEPGTILNNTTGTGNLFTDPKFVDAANGNLRLQPTSCAINAGDPATTAAIAGATDPAGNPRFYNNGRVDMGAYEYQGNRQSTTTTYPNTANNALRFDGTNNFVSVQFFDAVNCAVLTPDLTNALTIEYWFKGTNLQSAVRFQNGTDFVSAGWGTVGQQKHILSNDGGANGGIAVGAAATDGNWHHVAMTWQQNTTDGFRSYLDGVLVEKRTSANVPLPAISSLSLGSSNGTGEFMNGTLDEVRVWSVARTQAQIQQSAANCSPLSLPQTGLVMYYAFDQATANAANAGQTTLLNKANTDQYPGTLTNFALSGTTSNWVTGAPSVQPTRFYVKAGATGAGTGRSWADAFPDLQSALNYSCPQNLTEVWVAAGTYYPDQGTGQTNNNRNSAFALKNGLSILGGFPPTGNPTESDRNPTTNPTILSGDLDKNNTLDGNDAYHVINNPAGLDNTALLDGFVITGGNANGDGNAGTGGGVFNNGYSVACNPSFVNCIFRTNAAVNGGALFSPSPTSSSSSLQLTNCNFLTNTATNGAAIYLYYGNAGLANCSFQGNAAANRGGAIYMDGSNAGLTNCSFQSNTATALGGGIYNISSTPRFTNCSFQTNAAGQGGAFYNGVFSNAGLTNCVLFGNGGSNSVINAGSGTTTATYCLLENTITGVNVNGPGNRTTTTLPFASTTSVALLACSPAINAGNNAAYATAKGPATDLAGQSRIFGTTIDMGAVEFQGEAAPPLTITPTPSLTITTGGSLTLTASSATAYLWSNGATTNPIVLTNLTSATALSVTATTGGCAATASAAISVTSAVDLTPSLTLPQANFASGGAQASRNFTVSVVETGGQPTAAGSIRITITLPLGYTIAFNNSLTTLEVTGGSVTALNNADWELTASAELQLSLRIKPGQAIGARGLSTLGFTITRSGASKGAANITVNVADDVSQTYDVNPANNVYARVINAL